MSSNFSDFGDLILLIGDFCTSQRALDMPACFQEMLKTDKIRHVLCTGNIGSSETYEKLNSIAGTVHIVRGDMDRGFDFPEEKIVEIGELKIGLIHGHQLVPWGDKKILMDYQRKVGCDVLVYGGTHQNVVAEIGGKYFFSPGSATGAFHPRLDHVTPSFMLMAARGSNMALYTYEEKDGKALVVMNEFKKPEIINGA